MATTHENKDRVMKIDNTSRWTIIVILLWAVQIHAGPQKYEAGIAVLKAKSEVSVFQDEVSGQLRYVTGPLSNPITKGGEVASVLQFLTEHKTAYGIKNPAEELVVRRTDRDELGMQHIRMGQFYRGLAVYGSEMIAHISREGILNASMGLMSMVSQWTRSPR